jgi:hypothetical protein
MEVRKLAFVPWGVFSCKTKFRSSLFCNQGEGQPGCSRHRQPSKLGHVPSRRGGCVSRRPAERRYAKTRVDRRQGLPDPTFETHHNNSPITFPLDRLTSDLLFVSLAWLRRAYYSLAAATSANVRMSTKATSTLHETTRGPTS